MLKRKTFKKNTCGQDSVWEVHLAPETVEQIRKIAKDHKRSMSWVVRFCINKLIRKRILAYEQMHEMVPTIRHDLKTQVEKGGILHRFQLCLYGEDEISLRELALRMRLTVSMTIRIALCRYLALLADGRIPHWRFFWFGIKLCKKVNFFTSHKNGLVIMDFRIRQYYQVSDFWGIPDGPLPDFLKTG